MANVLVVGAGPVGLTMAAELARHGTRCRIIDQLLQASPYCRAIGVTPRTLELWDSMGIARDMIDAGLWINGMRSIIYGQPSKDVLLDLGDLPYSELGLPQYETERILARHLGRLGLAVERGVALTELHLSDDGVRVRLDHVQGASEEVSFRYVIGCDGAHSVVRQALGINFAGEAFPMIFMLGDVHIDWGLPRGLALRALRLKEGDAPDMFIAIPLPEPNRYRVSTLAPPDLDTSAGSEHGIQSELPGPQLQEIQAVADALLPDRPRLSDLRWSSLFRISMRLAEHYRQGRVFIAGDAAHIHPPTGGQGMNTGIQDAHNLAWKLALVLAGDAPETLLDSYESERRPVGAEVVARTRAASENYGREPGGKLDRLADTQLLVSYRNTPWVRDDADGLPDTVPQAGDRAPDAGGLRRHGIGFPLRLFDVLRGTEHLVVAHLTSSTSEIRDLGTFAGETNARFGSRVRITAVASHPHLAECPGVALYHDAQATMRTIYGSEDAVFLIRPDGYIGWRGRSWRDAHLQSHLNRILQGASAHANMRGRT